jgi:hypothetical protein
MTIFSSLMGNDAFPNGINYWHDGFTQNDSTNRMSMGRDRIELRRESRENTILSGDQEDPR